MSDEIRVSDLREHVVITLPSGYKFSTVEEALRSTVDRQWLQKMDLIWQVAALQAEVERLRKAGDGLMFEGETMAHEVSWNPAPWDRVVAAWVAAKEGGAK